MDSREILRILLEKRKINGESEIAEFLSPKPKRTYDPFLLDHMQEGVDLLLETIEKGEKICIYGDYDVDGITSVCILKTVLSRFSPSEISHYIPSRFDEGYGLNRDAIEKIKGWGTKLIITVDCGSNSAEEVEYARSLGMDVIVTDHHEIKEHQADCILINPKKPGCPYPFKELAGCGVAFKLAQALIREKSLDKRILNSCLDLVAMGTIADIMPLIDENRTLVKYGIHLLNRKYRLGLRFLTERIYPNKETIASEDVAYGIVPHINAAGRMEHGLLGVEFLLCDEEERCKELAERLIEYNSRRKEIQEEMVEEGLKLVAEQCSESLFPIVKMDHAHEGIIGIVAGRLKDELRRPVAVVMPVGSRLKGSARSIPDIDLFETMSRQVQWMEKLGGHKGACGFSLREDCLSRLRKGLQEDMEARQKERPELFLNKKEFDLPLSEKDITLELARAIESMEPFGSGNPRPVFLVEDVSLSHQEKLGETGSHGRFMINFPGGKRIGSVLFHRVDKYEDLLFGGEALDLTGRFQINRWRDREEIRIIVEEMYARRTG